VTEQSWASTSGEEEVTICFKKKERKRGVDRGSRATGTHYLRRLRLDFDLLASCLLELLLGFGDSDFEYSLLEIGMNVLLLNTLGQGHGAVELSKAPFTDMSSGLKGKPSNEGDDDTRHEPANFFFFLFTTLSRDVKFVFSELDLYRVLRDARKFSSADVFLVIFVNVRNWLPHEFSASRTGSTVPHDK